MQTFTRFTAVAKSNQGPTTYGVHIDYTQIVSVEDVDGIGSRVTLINCREFVLAESVKEVFAAMIESDRALGVPCGRCQIAKDAVDDIADEFGLQLERRRCERGE